MFLANVGKVAGGQVAGEQVAGELYFGTERRLQHTPEIG